VWGPFVTEIFKGIEYLSKLFFLKNHQRDAKKTFVNFVRLFSDLDPDLIEALWEFRCGIIHHGTLYNHTSRGVYRFGVRVFLENEPAIKRDINSPLTYVDGSKYLVNLRALPELMEKAQRYVFDDMTKSFPKYVLSEDFYIWIGRSWNFQYLPSAAEMRKFQESPGTGYPIVDPASEEISRKLAEVVIVEYEEYVWTRYIRTRFPQISATIVGVLSSSRRRWFRVPKKLSHSIRSR
jgi:hypothetical protein